MFLSAVRRGQKWELRPFSPASVDATYVRLLVVCHILEAVRDKRDGEHIHCARAGVSSAAAHAFARRPRGYNVVDQKNALSVHARFLRRGQAESACYVLLARFLREPDLRGVRRVRFSAVTRAGTPVALLNPLARSADWLKRRCKSRSR